MFCRFCLQLFKTKSDSETLDNTSTNNQTTGFPNRAVSIAMDTDTDGYEGLKREDEGYEKLRGGSNTYEEITDPVDGYLDPQMPGQEETTGAASDGYLHPQIPSEEYDYVEDTSVQTPSGMSGYDDVVNEPLEYEYVRSDNV